MKSTAERAAKTGAEVRRGGRRQREALAEGNWRKVWIPIGPLPEPTGNPSHLAHVRRRREGAGRDGGEQQDRGCDGAKAHHRYREEPEAVRPEIGRRGDQTSEK